jgi:probable rRNA maturation factor
MNYSLDIQHVCQETLPVSNSVLQQWAELALNTCCEKAELTLRFVDKEEITELNSVYRQQNKATNVLAFPANIPDEIELDYPFLGDIIICPAVLLEESITLRKPLDAHWALIVIHGILHLLGYDHIKDAEAEIMQALEVQLLQQLGFDNPYSENSEDHE